MLLRTQILILLIVLKTQWLALREGEHIRNYGKGNITHTRTEGIQGKNRKGDIIHTRTGGIHRKGRNGNIIHTRTEACTEDIKGKECKRREKATTWKENQRAGPQDRQAGPKKRSMKRTATQAVGGQEGSVWQSLDIPVQTRESTRTFSEWIDHSKVGQETAEWCKAWELEREVQAGESSAVVMRRGAERKMKGWTARRDHRKKEPPPNRLVRSIVRWDVLPTLTANAADRYYLPGLKRHMTAREICAAYGATGVLETALLAAEEREKGEGTTARMLGAAIDIDVATLVAEAALKKAGMLEQARNEGLTYADVCSGVGTLAAAIERITRGRMQYAFAAEKDGAKRRVLEKAWEGYGLKSHIHRDAKDIEAITGEQVSVDVFGATPDCGRWSRLATRSGNERRRQRAREAARDMKTWIAYAIARQPAIVIIESVSELQKDGKEREHGEVIEENLQRHLPTYQWYKQVVGARKHAGKPMDRERAFWVGVRREEEAKRVKAARVENRNQQS